MDTAVNTHLFPTRNIKKWFSKTNDFDILKKITEYFIKNPEENITITLAVFSKEEILNSGSRNLESLLEEKIEKELLVKYVFELSFFHFLWEELRYNKYSKTSTLLTLPFNSSLEEICGLILKKLCP